METEKISPSPRRRFSPAGERKAFPKASRHLSHLLQWYSQLNSQSLQSISRFYSRDLFFKDPIQEIYTVEDLYRYYNRMLRKLTHAEIIFENIVEENHQAFVSWVMSARVLSKDYTVHGTTHFKFNTEGLCEYHRDYFDLSEDVYERIPLFGRVFREFKRIFH